MSAIIFLGTGSSTRVFGNGKNHRLQSSALVTIGRRSFLIDVTQDFLRQSQLLLPRIDAIFFTHAHRDAAGGIAQLYQWWKRRGVLQPIPVYSHPLTIRKVRQRFRHTNHLRFCSAPPGRPIRIFGANVTALKVVHSMQPGFPTLGWRFTIGRKQLTYISDIGRLTPAVKRFVENSTLLVIDGALWHRSLPAHLDIIKALPTLCGFRVGRIVFTQIGRSVPPHYFLCRYLKKYCSKAVPAYDGRVVRW